MLIFYCQEKQFNGEIFPVPCPYTGFVGFKYAKSSVYWSTQAIHSNRPSTSLNNSLRVDIKPQFLQTCILAIELSFMLVSGGKLYSHPRR
jgi:hypothetical protein